MTDIIKRDPLLKSLLSWPRWLEDLDDFASQRGLKVYETDNDIIAEAVVAGVPAKDVDVHIEDGVLTIKAEAKEEEKEKQGYKMASYKYYYTAALSGGQWDKAEAEVKNGIVIITIPKTESARPRKIKVKAVQK